MQSKHEVQLNHTSSKCTQTHWPAPFQHNLPQHQSHPLHVAKTVYLEGIQGKKITTTHSYSNNKGIEQSRSERGGKWNTKQQPAANTVQVSCGQKVILDQRERKWPIQRIVFNVMPLSYTSQRVDGTMTLRRKHSTSTDTMVQIIEHGNNTETIADKGQESS